MLMLRNGFLGMALWTAALLQAPLSAAGMAVPGTVNYVEGQASINGRPLSSRSVGSAQVNPDQVLETDRGKAEILLTPGVFLRVGDHSAVRMVSPGLANTQLKVLRGEAMVEVTQLYKDNNIRILENGASAQLEKKGLYAFDTAPARVAVYDGEAVVTDNDRQVKVKKGREVSLDAAPLQAVKFDREAAQDSLYGWSRLRSEYLGEAAAQSARTIVVNRGLWGGPGWYWNSGWGMYSFLPGDGFPYSPFGYGFYSPAYFYTVPSYRYGVPRGFGGAPRGFGSRVFSAPAARAGGFGRR
jgi:hypothetical protein